MNNEQHFLLSGYSGRMGASIRNIVENDDLHCSVRDLFSPSLEIKPKSCVIDFSSPAGLMKSLELARERRIPFVSGTTGIGKAHHRALRMTAKKIPGRWAPNMSFVMQ